MFKSIGMATSAGRKGVRGGPSAGRPDAVIVGHFKGEKLDARTRGLDPSGSLASALTRPEASGEVGSIVEVHGPTVLGATRSIIVGLGEKSTFQVGSLRSVAGSLGRRLAAIKAQNALVALEDALASTKCDLATAGECLGVGLGLIAWNHEALRGSATTTIERSALQLTCRDDALRGGMERGLELAKGSNLARTLSNTPPNIATPAYMAGVARKLARSAGLGFDVFEGEALERERFTGLINVGKASENLPCMIRLEYRPTGRGSGRRPVVLIGKTMCYDSGGLSLKVNNGMKGMKRDKDGGCGVLGAMQIIARAIKPAFPVVALLPAAENSISDEAYRPDDVITYRNGVTVEVTNTDAEGRLILADALCWACEKEKPTAIIDAATLTGGVVVALGSTYAGMFCEDDGLRSTVEQAAARTGELVWRLPMHSEYREMMRSPIADIVNSAPVREAHPIQGAAFLSYFVEAGVPWCHLDIAGTHATEKDKGPFVAGPTGYGARLLAQAVELMRP